MTRSNKLRADILTVERGLADSRARAQALILGGKVYSGERRIEKPGETLRADAPLTLRTPDHPWVSRGGIKLAHALEHFGIDPQGMTTLDIGASSGGFTDVLLAHGASKVYAVDVGSGQLAWRLRNDKRVVVLEKTNARHLTREQIPEPIDMIVCDASFIGLKTILAAPIALARQTAILVALIKPQFEVGRGQVGRGGVVRDPALHRAVLESVVQLALDRNWGLGGVCASALRGAEGNQEFFVHLVPGSRGLDASRSAQ
ncbi:MAG: TlyA family RNA methyltransferase, partial [Alphaproteobacteria bacterium]|nr:TlyA family RNA methyltransferase [Alphaproteobacteria bacterium]